MTTKVLDVAFGNGYGVSVITGGYGSEAAPYELAVLKDGALDYTTPITNDVIGHLTAPEVLDLLQQIADLPKAVR